MATVVEGMRMNHPAMLTNGQSPINRYVIRPALYEDFRQIVDWTSNLEDWELAAADFLVWRKCFSPESFLCAVDAETGLLMGFCAGVKHGEDIGFVGMYYVKPEHRGCGVGSALFQAVCRYLDGRNLCMAAALTMVEKYRQRTEFRIVSDWCFRTANGQPNLAAFQAPPVSNVRITAPLSDALAAAAIAFDAKVAGIDRTAWCRHWLCDHPTGRSLLAVDETDGRCVGFIQRHEFCVGKLRIGPLYAETTAIARRLMFELLHECPDRHIRFSFMATDERTLAIAQDLGLEQTDDDLRMHTRSEIPFDRQRTFCFSDCEVNFV